MNLKQQKSSGAILAARYAFMPNKLRYCGGDENSQLFNYVSQNHEDKGLEELLEEFATMYPYLRLIAEKNKILDPFDARVVEAYWIGNDLLNNIDMNNFYRYMVDEQQLKKKFNPKLLEKVFGKIPLGAKPHHSWHVFNIPKRTGHYPVEHTLETMDKCRIGWGIIKKIHGQSEDLINQITVEYEPLAVIGGKLTLGETVDRDVWLEFDGKSFVDDLSVGDTVSIHWDWVCDVLSDHQLLNLKKWTRHNLLLANAR